MAGRPDAPETWNAGDAYKADDTAASGVIGILEIAQSDFAKLQSETEMQEQTAQREYQNLMNDSQVKKAVFDKDIEYKQNTKVKLESLCNVQNQILQATRKSWRQLRPTSR